MTEPTIRPAAPPMTLEEALAEVERRTVAWIAASNTALVLGEAVQDAVAQVLAIMTVERAK